MLENLLCSDGFIVLNKKIVREIGLNESVLIGLLYSEYNFWKTSEKLTNDGYFYCTRDKIEYNTGFSSHVQRTIIKKLEELNILDTTLRGLPAKTYYKINESELLSILSKEDSTTNNESLTTNNESDKHKMLICSTSRDCSDSQHNAYDFNIINNIYNNKKEKETNNKNKNVQSTESLENSLLENSSDTNLSINKKSNKESKLDKKCKVSNKKSKKDKVLELLYKKCVEYEISENVLEPLEKYITRLIDDNRFLPEEKIDSILSNLSRVDEQTQIKAINLSLERGYMTINPDWLKQETASRNFKKDPSIYFTSNRPDPNKKAREREEKLKNSPYYFDDSTGDYRTDCYRRKDTNERVPDKEIYEFLFG